MSEEHQPEPIHDPPIEHDSLGQAIVTLPLALAEGAEELVAWGVSETIIPAAEYVIDKITGDDDVPASAANLDLPISEETSIHATYAAHEDAL
jgi:hypothetical protein